MSTASVVTCDVCGAQKKEVNHWFNIWIAGTRFLCSPAECELTIAGYCTYKDCCGLECATKLFQRFLAHGTLEQRS